MHTTIPLETFLHVFLHLHHSAHRAAIGAPKNPLGTIRLVCRLWDTAVTETSLFWTTLRFGQKTNPGDIEWLALLALHFKRSKDLPLDLFIWSEQAKRYVFDALAEHVSRWRSVTIYDSAWDDTDPADIFGRLEMPNVTTIDMTSGRPHPLQTIIKAPKLQRLLWNHGDVTFPEGCPPSLQTIILQEFDYDQRHDHRLGNVSLQDIFLFQDTLQELSFKPLGDSQTYTRLEQPTFLQLHTLRLDGTIGLKWLHFMEHCQFPNLHTFGIKLDVSHQLPSAMPIWPSIQKLEWRWYRRTHFGSPHGQSILRLFEPFLASCPNMTALSFLGEPEVGDGLELLVLAEEEKGYCPKLGEIAVESCSLKVLEFVTARRPSLKTISMQQWHPNDMSDVHHDRLSLLLPDLIRSRVKLFVRSEEN